MGKVRRAYKAPQLFVGSEVSWRLVVIVVETNAAQRDLMHSRLVLGVGSSIDYSVTL